MKTAVPGEDADRSVIYNPSLVALLDHYGSAPKACRACRAKTKGKVERPFRYIRQDFFLDRTFRSLDDLNAQFDDWRGKVANPRVHATTGRIVDQAFAEEQGYLVPLPAHPYDAVLTVERRAGRDGMVSVGGNLYSVPDAARKRVLEVQRHPAEVRIFEDPVVATALLDRLLHHAVVVRIEGASCRPGKHADLIPEHVLTNAPITPPSPPKKRGRPRKETRTDD